MTDTIEARDFANPENNGTFVVPMSEELARWVFTRERTCAVCGKHPVACRVPDDFPGLIMKIEIPDEPLCAVCVVWASNIIWVDEWVRRKRERDKHGSPDPVGALQHEREPGLGEQRTRLVGELGRRLAASPRLQSV